MARSKRRKKSGSILGLFVLEVIALAVFFFLFTHARAHREAQQVQPETQAPQTQVVESVYQMHETSPLQNLLANNQFRQNGEGY